MDTEDASKQRNKSPLCVFRISPSLSIQLLNRPSILSPSRLTSTERRRGASSKIRIKPRFKQTYPRFSHKISKYLIGRVDTEKKDSLSLNEVLDTLKQVWISPNNRIKSPADFAANMSEQSTKIGCPSEASSPIMLRRRLSAPETIMRKHVLAQQRLESQDSDATQASESNSWRADIGSSDLNLNKKRDSGIRRSTLLRRLWGNNKPLSERKSRLSGAYYDWQYSFGKVYSTKSTHSLSSTQSSPEHKRYGNRRVNDDFKTSPSHSSKTSPKHNLNSDKMHSPKKPPNAKNMAQAASSCKIDNSSTTTSKTETEYENYSTRSTGSTSTTSYTIYSDNYDSAYTYSRSNYTKTSNTSPSTTFHTEKVDNVPKFEPNRSNTTCDDNSQTDHNSNLNTTTSPEVDHYMKYSSVSESTQTADATNLNVISNVQLSQSTLNLIFNQVLHDMEDKSPQTININTFHAVASEHSDTQPSPQSKVIKVQEMPSFYLKRKDDMTIGPEQSRILKYMLSNVGTGGHYSKPAEVPQIIVPRYSALPRTSSMEVNTSSGDYTDKESDTLSLVDSLEDPSSPRLDVNLNRQDLKKSVQGDISPFLPDNSNQAKPKPATFYIPIETDAEAELKPVADHLPAKVKERLWKRQVKREQKIAKTKFTPPLLDRKENQFQTHADNINSISNLFPDVNINRAKRKSKTVLPSIDPLRKFRQDRDSNKLLEDRIKDKLNKSIKRKSVFASEGNSSDLFKCKLKGSHWNSRTRLKSEKLNPICTRRSQDSIPKSVYNKTDASGNRIEILEIMECVASPQNDAHGTKVKSRIPVLVSQKSLKSPRQLGFEKPCYLDFDHVQTSDPKIDQLIANILIDSLNIADDAEPKNEARLPSKISNINERRPSAANTQMKQLGQLYKQKFDAIPEELSQQSFEDVKTSNTKNEDASSNNNNEDTDANAMVKTEDTSEAPNGKAAVAGMREENLSSIPKGWITFYTLHNRQGSPDSTSDEGTNKNETLQKKHGETEAIENKPESSLPANKSSNHQIEPLNIPPSYKNVPDLKQENQSPKSDSLSSTESENCSPQNQSKNRHKKKHPPVKTRFRNSSQNGNNPHNIQNAWSVTVSSSHNYGQLMPDLEMRLKFPQDKTNNQSDSGFTDENFHDKTTLPYLPNKSESFRQFENRRKNEVLRSSTTRLPEIKSGVLRKRSESGIPDGVMIPARMEPRQTRTSSRRYYLSRPRPQFPTTYESEDIIALREENRQLCEILKRLPKLLKITGNAISPERKPKVPTMSERDLTRNLYVNHQ